MREATAAAGCGLGTENALPRYDQYAYDQIKNQARASSSPWISFEYLRLGPDLLNGITFLPCIT